MTLSNFSSLWTLERIIHFHILLEPPNNPTRFYFHPQDIEGKSGGAQRAGCLLLPGPVLER